MPFINLRFFSLSCLAAQRTTTAIKIQSFILLFQLCSLPAKGKLNLRAQNPFRLQPLNVTYFALVDQIAFRILRSGLKQTEVNLQNV